MKRKAKAIYPTMKVDPDTDRELDMAFEECQATIREVHDIKTEKFGEKTIALLEKSDDGKLFNVFVNNFSMQKLIEEFGDEDTRWIGKVVELKQEQDPQYKNDMIVLHPVQ